MVASDVLKKAIMSRALAAAKKAFKKGEVPVGALIVTSSGEILAEASNKAEASGCQTGHAEMLAIQKACKKIGNWRLDGCWLFVTLQPCMMCLGLASLSRLAGVFYGAPSNLFGFEMPKDGLKGVYKGLEILSGLKERECAAILTRFFVLARQKSRLKEKKKK